MGVLVSAGVRHVVGVVRDHNASARDAEQDLVGAARRADPSLQVIESSWRVGGSPPSAGDGGYCYFSGEIEVATSVPPETLKKRIAAEVSGDEVYVTQSAPGQIHLVSWRMGEGGSVDLRCG